MKRKYLIALVSIMSICLTAVSAWIQGVPESDVSPSQAPSPTLYTVTISPTGIQGAEYAKVVSVVDGDTIKIEGGEVVRYIGINTPETVAPNRPIECYGKEASAKNKELVLGKAVRLEKDISNRDRYGRLLRYIWIGETLINEQLVEEGFAQVSTYPPDVKYENRLLSSERRARTASTGLWGANCPIVKPEPDLAPATIASPSMPTPTFVCDCTKACDRMSCSEAQFMLKSCGCTNRDANSDGVACESECH